LTDHATECGSFTLRGQIRERDSVYDQAGVVAENVREIRDRVSARFAEPFEVMVVSDGSVDGTAERLLKSELQNVRVLYYDRNLGKGAVLGMLAITCLTIDDLVAAKATFSAHEAGLYGAASLIGRARRTSRWPSCSSRSRSSPRCGSRRRNPWGARGRDAQTSS